MYSKEKLINICNRYVSEELSIPELAKMYDISHQYLYGIFRGHYRRAVIPDDLFAKVSAKYQDNKPKGLGEAERARIRESNASIRSLAGLYGVARSTIRRIKNDDL